MDIALIGVGLGGGQGGLGDTGEEPQSQQVSLSTQ